MNSRTASNRNVKTREKGNRQQPGMLLLIIGAAILALGIILIVVLYMDTRIVENVGTFWGTWIPWIIIIVIMFCGAFTMFIGVIVGMYMKK